MNRFSLAVLALVAFLFSTSVRADEIEDAYQRQVVWCKDQTWSDIGEVQSLELQRCAMQAQITALTLRLEACVDSDAELRGQIQAQQTEISGQLAQIQEQLKARSSAPSPSAPASSAPTHQPPMAGQVFVAGALHQRVASVSTVSTYSVQSANRLKLDRLSAGARKWAKGHSRVMVLVTNRGGSMPVSVPEPGRPTNFVEVYADLDGDGQTEPVPYKVVDTSRVQTLWMGWLASDDLDVWYLVPSGQYERVMVGGVWQDQDVWIRAPGRGNGKAHYGGNAEGGQRQADATAGSHVW